MSTELTATEENVVNRRNDTMNLAINKVMGLETQSYDEFMNGFQHITKETTVYQKKSSTNVQLPISKTEVVCNMSSVIGILPQPSKSEQTSDGELEEEVLDCGTTVKSEHSCTPCVKFDNFVDEDVSDDDYTDTPGYIASFGEIKQDSIPDNAHFHETGGKYANNTDNHNMQDSVGEKKNLADHLIFDKDDDLEEPDNKSEIVIQEKMTENSTLEGKVKNNINEEMEKIETGSNIDPLALFPGEAEPELDVKEREIIKHTHLSFTTVKCTESCDQSKQVCSTCTDEVQPFSLDEEFDYDNVTLTPKFTAQEVEYLKSFLPKNSAET